MFRFNLTESHICIRVIEHAHRKHISYPLNILVFTFIRSVFCVIAEWFFGDIKSKRKFVLFSKIKEKNTCRKFIICVSYSHLMKKQTQQWYSKISQMYMYSTYTMYHVVCAHGGWLQMKLRFHRCMWVRDRLFCHVPNLHTKKKRFLFSFLLTTFIKYIFIWNLRFRFLSLSISLYG